MASVPDALSVLSAMITPAVLISACGSLILVTSTRLMRAVDRVRDVSLRFAELGEHHVMLIGDRERVELVHAAQDRALFAEGALRAARWIAGKPAGTYSMNDVLGL